MSASDYVMNNQRGYCMLNKHGNMNCTMVYTSLCGHAMQPWYSIEITRDGSSKTVAFLSRIHVNRRVECKFSWSSKFSDSQILKDCDLRKWTLDKYGEVCQ